MSKFKIVSYGKNIGFWNWVLFVATTLLLLRFFIGKNTVGLIVMIFIAVFFLLLNGESKPKKEAEKE